MFTVLGCHIQSALLYESVCTYALCEAVRNKPTAYVCRQALPAKLCAPLRTTKLVKSRQSAGQSHNVQQSSGKTIAACPNALLLPTQLDA